MAITLVATPGADDANTYCTLAEAEAYHETRLHNDDWVSASSSNKNKALAWATRLLDDLIEWNGSKTDVYQPLRFPRYNLVDTDGQILDSSTIPQFLKNATAEYAMHLIIGDRVKETDLKGYQSIKVASIRITPDKYDNPAFIPPSVWEMIKDYGVRKNSTSFRGLSRA